MAKNKNDDKGMSRASAAVAIARTEGEIVALENEKSFGKRVDEIDESIAAKKKYLAELRKVK